jgi:carbon monoxide dehydrogenase subunit G
MYRSVLEGQLFCFIYTYNDSVINRFLWDDILVRIEKSIVIKAPPERVWEMLALDRHSEWMDGYKSVEYTSEVHTPEDKYRVGAIAQITEKRGKPYAFKIMESLESEKIVFSHSTMNMTMAITLKPTEAGIEMTMAGEGELPGGIFGKFIEKLFAERMGEKQIEKSLENLKSIVEK